ncbi:MAG: hypothetical protein ACRD99_03640 [Nitrososphaera sp.]
MATFPTYGMAGIGIAAAIGFVFVLSFLGNNSAVDDGDILQSNAPIEQQRTSEPLADQESGGDASMSAKDSAGEIDSAPAGQSAMMLDLRPTLTSVVVLDKSRELIGEVVPNMEFKAGEPVFIQASFSNGNPDGISDHFIAMSIRNAGGSETLAQDTGEPFDHAANFQGNIAANSSIALELYWTPQRAGDYTLLVFSTTPGDLSSTEPVEPTVAISIAVIE